MCRKLKLSISRPIISLVQATPVQNLSTVFIAGHLCNGLTVNCRFTGDMVVGSGKYDVKVHMLSTFESRMTVTVRKLQKDDAGTYRCIAKNSLGEVESSIRLYGKHDMIN